MNAKMIIPVKYRRNIVKLDPLTTHGRRIFLRSTRENAFYFVVFLAFLLFFFSHEYRLPCHLISTLRWTFIPQIDNHSDHCSPLSHTISLRAWSTKNSSWCAFVELSEFVSICLRYLQSIRLILIMKTPGGCVTECFLGGCNSSLGPWSRE